MAVIASKTTGGRVWGGVAGLPAVYALTQQLGLYNELTNGEDDVLSTEGAT